MKRKSEISASMMCADLLHLVETLRIFEKKKIEYLHIDVMDGEFVPNFGLGADYIRNLRTMTSIPLDFHLMIQNPEKKYNWLGIRKEDMVSIHYESTCQVQRAIDGLKEIGCRRFIAINPATPFFNLEEVLDDIDGINLLMVNPGFAGQKIVPSTLRKAERLYHYLTEKGKDDLIIQVDGNITPEHGHELRAYGASVFVAGSSSIFKKDISKYEENIDQLRGMIL